MVPAAAPAIPPTEINPAMKILFIALLILTLSPYGENVYSQEQDALSRALDRALLDVDHPQTAKTVVDQVIQAGRFELLAGAVQRGGWQLQQYCLDRLSTLPKRQGALVLVKVMGSGVLRYRDEPLNGQSRFALQNGILQEYITNTAYKILNQAIPPHHGSLSRAEADALTNQLRAVH